MQSDEITTLPQPKYLQQEESIVQQCKDFISTLPEEKGWVVPNFYQYQGFWYTATHLQGVISCQKHFQARNSDIFLVTAPKSGTTWLKAIVFAIINRTQYPIITGNNNHPLITQNPHDLVPFLEIDLYVDNQIPDFAPCSFSRLFSSHMPFSCLPESVRSNSSTCKIVYLCRNPKDVFVSLWHFTNKLRLKEMGENSIAEVFDLFCKGVSIFGPFWDDVLEYWNLSKQNPDRILFLKYEDMKAQPEAHLRRLSEVLGCPFGEDEERSGVVEGILKLCSFGNLNGLEFNKNGKLSSGHANNAYFRKGDVGDWKNYLDFEMVEKIDRITKEKFFGSGLEL